MSSVAPRSRPTATSMSLASWFGPQLGSTAWLITGAIEFGAKAPRIALAWVACFALANAAGTWLWFQFRRGRFRPMRGLQILVLLIGGVGATAFAILDWAAPPAVRALGDPRQGYRVLLIGVVALLTLFAVLDQVQRSGPGSGEPGQDLPPPVDPPSKPAQR